jgi:predicted ATPase
MVQAIWGRDSELALVSQVLEAASADPVALVLSGEEGIGKTTLWKAVLSLAEDRGYRVLSARPVESEATFAFAAVADLLREDLDEAVVALPAPQQAALEGALLRADLQGPPDPKAVAFGFYGSLLALARSGPLIIGVDDVQWLDAPSARVLEFALRRLEGVSVSAVLASRSDGPGPSDRTPLRLDEGPLGERIHRIPIGPLGLDVLRQILRSKLRIRFPRWVLVQIHQASGGNPFLALELARALVRRGVDLEPGHALPIPQQLAELLRERLDSLSEPVRRMLVLVSASSKQKLR